MAPDRLQRNISGLASLDQPTRRALYDLVARRGDWTGRDAAAEELDLPRSVAAFHLDKLAEAGVVEVSFQRTTGRTGPGAGRPAKRYRRSADEVAASVPERRYDLAGSLLAGAIAEAERTGTPISDAVRAAATAAGRTIAEEVAALLGERPTRERRRRAVLEVLARYGYEPHLGRRGEIALVNCPFHRLAEEHRALVCGMNLDLLRGLLEGLGPGSFEARLEPAPGFCCVRISAP